MDTVKYCLGNCCIKYCLGCRYCFENSGQCAQEDDVKIIVNDLFSSDLAIVASPSYWGDVTGQMKVFFDRCTPYCDIKNLKTEKPMSKGIAVAVRAGMNKEENNKIISSIEHFLGHLNISMISSFTEEGIDTIKDLENNAAVLEDAYNFGKRICSIIMEGVGK